MSDDELKRKTGNIEAEDIQTEHDEAEIDENLAEKDSSTDSSDMDDDSSTIDSDSSNDGYIMLGSNDNKISDTKSASETKSTTGTKHKETNTKVIDKHQQNNQHNNNNDKSFTQTNKQQPNHGQSNHIHKQQPVAEARGKPNIKHHEHAEKSSNTNHSINSNHSGRNPLVHFYDIHYKHLLVISILLLLFSVSMISYKMITTGDFVSKGISLKGGITISINTKEAPDSEMLKTYLIQKFPESDINVRTFNVGVYTGFVVEASDLTESQIIDALKDKIPDIKSSDYSSEIVGPSLGTSFFQQTLKAVFIAFLFMSLVVYLYFGSSTKYKWLSGFLSVLSAFLMFYANSWILYIIPLIILGGLIVLYFKDNIPSFGIMLCAFSDVLFSLAIFNLMGMKLNTAGVAAFLMLIGYSIDTDILLSVRVLKRKEGLVFDRIMGAMKTGMMMSFAAFIAVFSAYFFSHSEVIKEIMFILAVGLIGDVIFTWIQNAGILRWHLEKKGWK